MKAFLPLFVVIAVLCQAVGCQHSPHHAVSTEMKDFKGARAKQTASIITDQPVDKVFPLFSAEGEKKWVPGFDYINPMDSSEMYEDFFFTIRLDGQPKDGKGDFVFIVKKYDLKEHVLELYRIIPGKTFALFSIKSEALSEEKTKTTITLEQTGTTERGNEIVKAFTAEAHANEMSQWKQWIDAYLSSNSENSNMHR